VEVDRPEAFRRKSSREFEAPEVLGAKKKTTEGDTVLKRTK